MEGTALRDRVATRQGELSYKKGEVLLILDSTKSSWWVAERIEDWASDDDALRDERWKYLAHEGTKAFMDKITEMGLVWAKDFRLHSCINALSVGAALHRLVLSPHGNSTAHASLTLDGVLVHKYTRRELFDRAIGLANHLLSLKIPAKSRLLIWVDSSFSLLCALFGCMAAGFVAVPLIQGAEAEVAQLAFSVGASVILTTENLFKNLSKQKLKIAKMKKQKLKFVEIENACSKIYSKTAIADTLVRVATIGRHDPCLLLIEQNGQQTTYQHGHILEMLDHFIETYSGDENENETPSPPAVNSGPLLCVFPPLNFFSLLTGFISASLVFKDGGVYVPQHVLFANLNWAVQASKAQFVMFTVSDIVRNCSLPDSPHEEQGVKSGEIGRSRTLRAFLILDNPFQISRAHQICERVLDGDVIGSVKGTPKVSIIPVIPDLPVGTLPFHNKKAAIEKRHLFFENFKKGTFRILRSKSMRAKKWEFLSCGSLYQPTAIANSQNGTVLSRKKIGEIYYINKLEIPRTFTKRYHEKHQHCCFAGHSEEEILDERNQQFYRSLGWSRPQWVRDSLLDPCLLARYQEESSMFNRTPQELLNLACAADDIEMCRFLMDHKHADPRTRPMVRRPLKVDEVSKKKEIGRPKKEDAPSGGWGLLKANSNRNFRSSPLVFEGSSSLSDSAEKLRLEKSRLWNWEVEPPLAICNRAGSREIAHLIVKRTGLRPGSDVSDFSGNESPDEATAELSKQFALESSTGKGDLKRPKWMKTGYVGFISDDQLYVISHSSRVTNLYGTLLFDQYFEDVFFDFLQQRAIKGVQSCDVVHYNVGGHPHFVILVYLHESKIDYETETRALIKYGHMYELPLEGVLFTSRFEVRQPPLCPMDFNRMIKGANYHWLGATLSQFMGQLPDESEVSRFVSMVPTKKWAMNEPNSPSLSAQKSESPVLKSKGKRNMISASSSDGDDFPVLSEADLSISALSPIKSPSSLNPKVVLPLEVIEAVSKFGQDFLDVHKLSQLLANYPHLVMRSDLIEGNSLIAHAIMSQSPFSTDFVSLLLSVGDYESSSDKNENMGYLHLATKYGLASTIHLFLDNKFSNSAKTSSGTLPLHYFMYRGRRSLSCSPQEYRILFHKLLAGVDINSQTDAGETPLHYACTGESDEESILLLLDHGANPNIKAFKLDLTPAEMAEKCGKMKLAKLISSYSPPNLRNTPRYSIKKATRYLSIIMDPALEYSDISGMFLFANKVVSRSKLQETFLRQLNDPSSPKEELLNCLHIWKRTCFLQDFNSMAVENRELKLKLESMKDDPIVMAIFLEESKLRASLRTMDKARSDFLSCDKVDNNATIEACFDLVGGLGRHLTAYLFLMHKNLMQESILHTALNHTNPQPDFVPSRKLFSEAKEESDEFDEFSARADSQEDSDRFMTPPMEEDEGRTLLVSSKSNWSQQRRSSGNFQKTKFPKVDSKLDGSKKRNRSRSSEAKTMDSREEVRLGEIEEEVDPEEEGKFTPPKDGAKMTHKRVTSSGTPTGPNQLLRVYSQNLPTSPRGGKLFLFPLLAVHTTLVEDEAPPPIGPNSRANSMMPHSRSSTTLHEKSLGPLCNPNCHPSCTCGPNCSCADGGSAKGCPCCQFAAETDSPDFNKAHRGKSTTDLPKILNLYRIFSSTLCYLILSLEDDPPVKIAQLISQFIVMASQAYEEGNLVTAKCVWDALRHLSIRRLTHIWSLVPSTHKERIAEIGRLFTLDKHSRYSALHKELNDPRKRDFSRLIPLDVLVSELRSCLAIDVGCPSHCYGTYEDIESFSNPFVNSLFSLPPNEKEEIPSSFNKICRTVMEVMKRLHLSDECTSREQHAFLKPIAVFDRFLGSCVVQLFRTGYSNSQLMSMSLRITSLAPEVLTAEQQLFPHLKEVRNTIEDLTGLPITYSDFVLMKIGMVGNATENKLENWMLKLLQRRLLGVTEEENNELTNETEISVLVQRVETRRTKLRKIRAKKMALVRVNLAQTPMGKEKAPPQTKSLFEL